MAIGTEAADDARATLNRERVLEGAVAYADEHGIGSLSMRKLGASLGVEAMSLYNHVASKDDLLDGIVDRVFSEFEEPTDDADWRTEVRRCAVAAHEVLLRHPWVPVVSESRVGSGPRRLHYYDALLGVFRAAGFSVRAAYRANLTLDSYLYGFTLQEVSWPAQGDWGDVVPQFLAGTAPVEYPNLAETARLAGESLDLTADFEAGLDAVLDGLGALRDADPDA